MAFSKIEITIATNPTAGDIDWSYDPATGSPLGVLHTIVPVRSGVGLTSAGATANETALNYRNALAADLSGSGLTFAVASNVVTITGTFDGFVFSAFSYAGDGSVTAVITNEPFTPPFEIEFDSLSQAAAPCADVTVTLTENNGTGPFSWVSPLFGNAGLTGDLPRSGSTVTITLEDANTDQAAVDVFIPDLLTVAVIDNIQVETIPSGLSAVVTVFTTIPTGLTFEYSLDGTTFQTENIFTGILAGNYTLYISDQYGCVISQAFEVTLLLERLPAFRDVPLSNSFHFVEQQASPNGVNVHYNMLNVQPNDYTLDRFNNPKYFQPWTQNDTPQTQFRSNYDSISARLVNISDDSIQKTMTIEQKSNNIGQTEVMDCVVYDLGNNQSGVYFLSGNIYATAGGPTIDDYTLDGALPDWGTVGQQFIITETAQDGLFQVKQIIFDSALLVSVLVIDRMHTDANPSVAGVAEATYNLLNYETYEFDTAFNDVPEGCYRVEILMQDSLGEYQDSFWDSVPVEVVSSLTWQREVGTDGVYFEYSDNVDDGINYSTGIVHKQRIKQGLAFFEEYPLSATMHKDSKNVLTKLDGRTDRTITFSLEDVPQWVLMKMSLMLNKKSISMNGIPVQTEDSFDVNTNDKYQRVSATVKFTVVDFEQYFTDNFDINGDRGFLITETGFLKL